ncbi:MAG: hypothetical protein HFJ49_04485, partial [Clostridia bacterium]|nr:hypothetical protein [Clostridia bacterium]
MGKKKYKSKEEKKKVRQIQVKGLTIIGVILVIIGIIAVTLLNNRKQEELGYGGIEFNKEMDLSNINLIESSDETPI